MTELAWRFPALHRLLSLRAEPSTRYEPKHAIPPPVYWSPIRADDTAPGYGMSVTLPPMPLIYGGQSVTYRAGRLWVGGEAMEARR